MKKIKVALLVLVVISSIVIYDVIDYKIYKAKYPNTTVWMWLIDNK